MSEPLTVSAHAVDVLFKAKGRDFFAGEYVGRSSLTILVTRGHKPAASRLLSDLQISSEVQIAVSDTADFSLAQLDSDASEITSASDSLLSQGVGLTSWGVDPLGNRVRIGVDSDLQQASAEVANVLPPAQFYLVSEPAPNVTSNATTDSAPWSGGDLLNEPSGGTCTSGFSMVSSGVTYNSTAGHCGNGTFKQNGQGYGITIRLSDSNNGPTDAQIISTYPASSKNDIWVNRTSSKSITAWGDPFVGETNICFNGYYTQQSCGNVGHGPECVHFSNINTTTCGLYDVTCIATFCTLVQPGDSGGPVTLGTNTGAIGMIVGEDCSPGPCKTGYLTPVRAVMNALGVSVQT